ncbi:MAG TPA: ABC transporter permease subunit [Propionibacteriaceae bacterium]|jgi:ABC-2 type transport system permease protein|nr:ABC transporter permease subunit [Propionibacteriaceae bacterium]
MSAADVLVVGSPQRARVSSRFLRSELKIIFGRRRNIAGMGVLAALPVILAVSIRLSSSGQGGGPDFISGIAGNGLFVAFAALALELPLFLPLAVSAISGDSVAGEANLGTLRYLLAIPAGRTRLLVIKYLAIVIFAFAATFLVALVGTIMGLALFGGGDMTLLSGAQTSIADGVWRLVLSSLYLAAQFSALGAIGLFVSTLTEQPIGATIAIVLVNVLMFILDSIAQLDWLHPWLLIHWWTAFGDLLRDPIATESIQRGLITAVVYAGTFWLAAWARLSTKDISS